MLVTRSRRAAAGIALAAVTALGCSSWLTAAPAQAAAPTGSAKTVTAQDYDPDAADAPFPGLSVTVSQTDDLVQQGVTVSWKGAAQSTIPTQQTGGENFLQIAQCWGDEPGSDGTRPDRTTCQYGGFNLPGDSRLSDRPSNAVIAPQDQYYTAMATSWREPTTTAIPFVSATGKTIARIQDGQRIPNAPDLNNNEFFGKYTTNEVSWAGSGSDGSGSISFELQTAQQSPGLGCGNPVTVKGKRTGQSCWLVVIPRSDKDVDSSHITESGLIWQNWQHHLAVKLNFRPIGLSCRLGAAERQLAGSELAATAIGQWQPKLCNQKGGAIYSLLTGPESDAALAANGGQSAPLALTTRPLSVGSDQLTYAPIALTGISIAFAIDRQMNVLEDVPADVAARERQSFSSVKLNPRLLAKLLTASYDDALPLGADRSRLSGVRNITQDPEFLALNDKEWASMRIVGVGVSDALTPLGRSDTASIVWSYIMSDPSAADFLNGVPDHWGMHVNPYYSSNPRVNPSGTGLTYPRDDFPKADPTEFPGTASNGNADVVNLVTWRPYTASLDNSAYLVLRGDPQALGEWNPLSIPPKYDRASRALVGMQAVIGVTDTAAAARYQVVQASLLNPAGRFVTPTKSSFSAAAAVMTPDSNQKQVLRLDPAAAGVAKAADAYPLTVPVYAAANPAIKDKALRSDYADFITFAATAGQQPGTADGQLPDGYAPLPSGWKTQALDAAQKIRAGVSQPAPSPAPSSAPSNGPAASTPANPSNTSSSSKPHSAPSATPGPGPDTPADPQLGLFTALVPTGAALGVSAAVAVPLLSRFRRRL